MFQVLKKLQLKHFAIKLRNRAIPTSYNFEQVNFPAHLVFLLERLRRELHEPQVGEPRGQLVRAEHVLPLVQQLVQHPLRQAPHQQVPTHRVVQVRLEPLNLRTKSCCLAKHDCYLVKYLVGA